MIKFIVWCVVILSISFTVVASEGVVRQESSYSVTETMHRFENILKNKGFTVFTIIDHQKNAAKVNLDLRPTQVILFGNPKVGTLLMQCAQNTAIDLPQKALVTEDENNKVWLSYNAPSYLKKRHHIEGCEQVIDKVSGALRQLSKAAVTP